jgi:hypothetical protein
MTRKLLKTNNHLSSQIPGIFLTTILVILIFLVWPGFLEQFFSLNWKVGNIRPITYGLQLLLAVLTIIAFLKRNWINAYFSNKFFSRKRLIFTIIGFIISLSMTLAIIELSLRIFDLPFKTWEPSKYRRAQFDPEIGWTYVPNRSMRQRFVNGQPEIAIYADENGSRVLAPGVHHDKSVSTVLFIGCSFTFGFGVPYEETFVGRLEMSPQFKYQVVNLGVEGYGTDQALLILKRHFGQYNTKAVVYTFLDDHINRNHIFDRRLLYGGGRFVGTKPLFGLDRSGNLYLKKKPVRYRDLNDLRILACLKLAWKRWGAEPSPNLTMALIKEMKSFVESHGATFVLVYWNWWNADKGNFLLSEIRNVTSNVVDTGAKPPPGWREWNSEWKIPGDSHPSPQAHSRVANLIFEEFKRLGLVSNNKEKAS